ncbi:hypothetical protein BFW38_14945 [Terasakiispira papahanaumokuakeensis]|uniref:Uncharacterized protein n=1 Tax=Terasakiispira papahanaumokuakeensis TaxID=197479 RepID=A0A1E2VC93_9GAMM|nr:hypothetical protein BFW38_14945 [Terasakiispira papahanaumokuakeensis]
MRRLQCPGSILSLSTQSTIMRWRGPEPQKQLRYIGTDRFKSGIDDAVSEIILNDFSARNKTTAVVSEPLAE